MSIHTPQAEYNANRTAQKIEHNHLLETVGGVFDGA